MKLNSFRNKLGGAILGFSLLLGIGFASSTTAQAQYPVWTQQQQRQYEREQRRRQREWQREQLRRQREAQRAQQRSGYGNYGGYGGYNNGGYDTYGYGGSYELRQTALNAGYNEGRKAGAEDRSRGRGYNYANDSDYRNADKDYNSRYGNRALYQQYFRQAFVNGYADGYRGY